MDVEHKGRAVAAALANELKMKPGVAEKAARAIRLRNELQMILELVVNIRGRLESELAEAVSANFINKEFVTKLKDLTACYQTLTTCQINLNKSEKAMEEAMTPAQELKAVKDFIKNELTAAERYDVIHDLWAWHLAAKDPSKGGRPSTKEDRLPGE